MIYAVVLAAGESRRMGKAKQLLPFGGKTVLQTVVDRLQSSRVDGVLVVLGCKQEEIRRTLADRDIRMVLNPDYREGMFSSVRSGITALPHDATAFLICLGDQPRVDPNVVDRLIEVHENSGRGIVIPTCKGKRGHPTLISIRYREEILGLSGENGLKPLTRGHPEDTAEEETGRSEILEDIDTPQDYQEAMIAKAEKGC
jgi:molybdenum cofactor cytidylyltransferase